MRRTRSLFASAVSLVALVALAAPAGAHVTVNPREAEPGGYAKLAFRVPNERPDASTTRVEIAFPAEHPLASVSVRPHPGWTAEVQRTGPPASGGHGGATDASISVITWTADDPSSAIGPGQFDEFEVSVGPLPSDAQRLVFGALQTYDSGEVVRWIEAPSDGAEPEHPAPVLTLRAAEPAASAADPSASEAAASFAEDDDVDAARTLAVVALVLAALGITAGVVGIVLTRRR